MWVADCAHGGPAHDLDVLNMLAAHAACADNSVPKLAFHGNRLDHFKIFGQGARRNTLNCPRLPQEVRPLPNLSDERRV